jgi:predicted GIY-YIG superfamily endonuclease
VYILRCGDGTLYTGVTTNVPRRLGAHQRGKGAAYTRAKGAAEVLFVERAVDRSAALRREAAIKRLRRAQKLALIAAQPHRRRRPKRTQAAGA